MVFENVTLFEVHLDDARFSADTGRSDGRRAEADDRHAGDETVADDGAVETETAGGDETTGSSGRGRFVKLAAASVVVSAVATVVARRVAGRGDDPVAVDLESGDAFDDAAADEPERVDDPVSTPTPDGADRSDSE
ncbi:hypothetical protein C475_09122 [Halosimplex carlsbadense 2-9-1]|uniref:Uncharacterized protein n=1 Tax=Halosimplex carlsbadense 2-9-1 TaxID=797114 RepID=M0CWS1_9EURY|nr:hypothetical protein [Halosimplex carlsbadense]ELZ26339.1 hypothetical protein C475_09122 [Halosimplex carlsbadense 2-9-1]